MLYNDHIVNKLPEARVREIIMEAVEIEKEFVTDSLPVSLIGMNAELMCQYIEFVADFWMTRLGYPKIYNTKNPLDFMDMLSMKGKANFFESRVGAYKKASVGKTASQNSISFDEEF